MMSCTIEKMEISEHPMQHDMVSRIFSLKNIAIAAVGSPACIRTLWFRAYRLGELHRFYGAVVSAMEYALGKQVVLLNDCIRKAAELQGIQHVIVYASCLEVLTMCDLEGELKEICLPTGVSVHIFYRGPMVKRTTKPAEELEKILLKIQQMDTASRKCVPKDSVLFEPPPLPDFAKRMLELKDKDCDVLLLSPGGCKSCVEESCFASDVTEKAVKEKGILEKAVTEELGIDRIKAHFWATRLDDVSVSRGCPELYDMILHFFNTDRPLFLVGSAVFYMIGFDGRELAARLTQVGRETVWLESNGF